MVNKLKNTIASYIILMMILSGSLLIAKNKKNHHPEGGSTLTLVNKTSFTLNFPDPFHPQKSLMDLLAESFEGGQAISKIHIVSDLPPTGIHTEDFGTRSYGEEGTHFRVFSTEWPLGQELVVTIPKYEASNLAPFWHEEHKIFGETIGIDYNVEWSDDNNGWVITFFEEEVLTDSPDKGPSPQVEALRNRPKSELKKKLNSTAEAKYKKDKHPEGGSTLTLVNETSFKLYFPDPLYPQFKLTSLSDLGKIFQYGRVLFDLPPTGMHTEDFGDYNYGKEGSHFRVFFDTLHESQQQQLLVTIPKSEGPIFAPFWHEEHEIFGQTIGIDYNLEWSDDKNGWVITFFEEEVLTDSPGKGPSPEVEALRNRIKAKEKMKSRSSKTDSKAEL